MGTLGIAVASCFGLACEPSKRLAAIGTGDLSYPIAQRSSPIEQQRRACGTGEPLFQDSRELLRHPYLQRVGQTTSTVVFTADVDEAPLVHLTLPGGAAVTSLRASVDPTAQLARGRQMFTTFENLDPSTLYCYSVEGLTEPAGFYTAPPDNGAVRFIAFGDSGDGSSEQYAASAQMNTVPFDFLLHTGDLAYEDGRLSDIEGQYFAVYSELLRSVPSFPISGNHDYRTAYAAPLRQAFMLPENGHPDLPEHYYSFDRGNVHFVALDTELLDSTQADWLAADLAATNKPWKVVYAHRPPYSCGKHGSNWRVRGTFVPLFVEHGVQLVLSGHDHDYERTNPIDGVTYVVTGGGGHATDGTRPNPETAYAEGVIHFVYVEIEGSALLLHAIDGVGREFDSARLTL